MRKKQKISEIPEGNIVVRGRNFVREFFNENRKIYERRRDRGGFSEFAVGLESLQERLRIIINKELYNFRISKEDFGMEDDELKRRDILGICLDESEKISRGAFDFYKERKKYEWEDGDAGVYVGVNVRSLFINS